MNPVDEALIVAAVAARRHAYAPYSHFCVGAALRLADGALVTGVNVENSSYGLTLCAERAALAHAVGCGLQAGTLQAVAVAASANQPVAPCGACRQVLNEFAAPSMRLFLHNVQDGQTVVKSLAELLPMAFGPAALAPKSP